MVSLSDVRFSWTSQSTQAPSHPTLDPTLDIESFNLRRGERLFLYGPSGSGKSTLLSVIAAILKPQAGSIRVNNTEIQQLSGVASDQFRADNIGLVFQQFNLLPFMSVVDNVTLPCRFSGRKRSAVLSSGGSLRSEAIRLLEAMQLPDTLFNSRKTMQLSVGQQQRVAVARALMGQPPLLIADEPTSSLDTQARVAFLDLLFAELDRSKSSLLFVSHDESLKHLFDRSISLNEINHASVHAVASD